MKISHTNKIALCLALLSTACDDLRKLENKEALKSMAQTAASVADDEIVQYNIAQRADDKMHMCLQAGIVAAAYLQAKDEERWNAWRAIEKKDCRRAGVPL